MSKRLGIYGGTFAPIHNGHVRAAEAFLHSGLIDELIIIPARIPPHKQLDFTDNPIDRLNMVRLAFSNFAEYGKTLFVSDYEINSPEKSYTVNTLKHFIGFTDDITLLCGTDMFVSLDTWFHAEEIFKMAKIVYARREDDNVTGEEIERKKKDYKENFDCTAFCLDLPAYEMSSTDIRERIASGLEINSTVPERVADYIERNGLYREKKGQ